MPAPNSILSSFKQYLKTKFAMYEPWILPPHIAEQAQCLSVDHARVKEAMRKMSLTDPVLNKTLEYLWRTQRTREDIASALQVDPSTIRRRWDKGMFIILNWIFNGDISTNGVLTPVDLLAMDYYEDGDTLLMAFERYKSEQKALKASQPRTPKALSGTPSKTLPGR